MKGKSNSLKKFDSIIKNRYLLMLLLPGLIWYIVFCYLPMYGIVIGFKDFQLIYGNSMLENIFNADWVGLKHIKAFVNSYNFERVIRNTVLLFVNELIFSFPLPIIFALLLNET